MSDKVTAARDSDTSREPASSYTDGFAAAAHESIDHIADTANHAEQGIRSAATKTREAAQHAQDQVGAAADSNMSKLRSYIEQNPLTCAGIAFAIGVALSSIVRRP